MSFPEPPAPESLSQGESFPESGEGANSERVVLSCEQFMEKLESSIGSSFMDTPNYSPIRQNGDWSNMDVSQSTFTDSPRNDVESELFYLRNRNQQLEEQVNHFQQLLALDQSLDTESDANLPLALVVLPDNEKSRYYKDILEEFLANLPEVKESKIRREKKVDEYNPMYQHASFNLYSILPSDDNRANKIKMLYNTFVVHRDFFVDKCGQPLVNFDAALTDGWVIPSFPQEFKQAFGDPDQITEGKKLQMTCFNCGGAHNLKECTEKRDLVRISQNRQALIEKFGAAPGLAAKSTRYHMETSEVDKRFARFQAGGISVDLREALNLSRRSLPLHVYRMRQLGYPPGWLKEAEVVKSGLDFIADRSELTEDGEVSLDVQVPQEVTYNLDKLVNYPGFNNNMPDNVRDECNRMRPPMPPMQKHQQLSAWCVYLAGQKRANDGPLDEQPPAKRRSLHQEEEYVADDMEIAEDEPVMPIIENEEDPYNTIPALPPLPEEPLFAPPERLPMPPPVCFTNWWFNVLQDFIRVDTIDDAASQDNRSSMMDLATTDLHADGSVQIQFDAESTIEDTIKSLRGDEVISADEEETEETNPENVEEPVVKPEILAVFKLTEEIKHSVSEFKSSAPHCDINVTFPDKYYPETVEFLELNPSPYAEMIQLGEENSRFVSLKGLPEYWKFSMGIEPYESKEEIPVLGLYSRIMHTLKQWK